MMKFRLAFGVLLSILLAACQPTALSPTDTVWPSPQPFASPTLPASPAPPPTVAQNPTPTPHWYVVQTGDTMIGIAARFGLTLAELSAANPDVSPSFLQPGDSLQIPEPQSGLRLPPPPDFVRVEQVQCYPASAPDNGNTVCLVLVSNLGEQPVEDIAVRLHLLKKDEHSAEVEGFLLLDALFPGQKAPAVLYVQGDYAAAQVEAQIASAFPFDAESGSYAAARLQRVLVSGRGSLRTVSGYVSPRAAGDWRSLWVAVAGFDAQGRLVGARREILNSSGAEDVAFEIYLFSQAGEIESFIAAAIWDANPCPFCR